MDLIKAIQSLSVTSDQLSNEQLTYAKDSLQKFEQAVGELALLYDELGIENQARVLQLLALYEEIKQEIMERF